MEKQKFEIVDVEPNQPKRNLPWPVWPGYLEDREEAPSVFEKPHREAPAKKAASGASLETARKRQQARHQAANPQRRKEALGEDSACGSLLDRCRQEAEKATATEDEASNNVAAALAGIAELKRLVSADPGEEEELMRAYGAAGIRITRRTANQFTPLVKLVFPKKVQKPATVSRYASVLRFAEEEGVKPSSFVGFVRQNGGLAACASRATEKRRSAAGGSRLAGTAAAEALKARRRNAPKLALPPSIALPKEGLTSLLVERGPNGSWLILGHRRAPAGAVTSSSPVSARLTKPAEGRRG